MITQYQFLCCTYELTISRNPYVTQLRTVENANSAANDFATDEAEVRLHL